MSSGEGGLKCSRRRPEVSDSTADQTAIQGGCSRCLPQLVESGARPEIPLCSPSFQTPALKFETVMNAPLALPSTMEFSDIPHDRLTQLQVRVARRADELVRMHSGNP